MKLVVICPNDQRPVDLGLNVRTASEIPFAFNAKCPYCGIASYFRRDQVQAKVSSVAPIGGLAMGSVLGLVGGPLGALIGGIVGGGLGVAVQIEERKQAERFNLERLA